MLLLWSWRVLLQHENLLGMQVVIQGTFVYNLQLAMQHLLHGKLQENVPAHFTWPLVEISCSNKKTEYSCYTGAIVCDLTAP